MATMRWATTLLLAAAVLLGAALAVVGVAGGSDVLARPPNPNPAMFPRAGVPVYADAPDGWACQYLGTNDRIVRHPLREPRRSGARAARLRCGAADGSPNRSTT